MEALTNLNNEAQATLATRFDKEYATMVNFIEKAYVQGLNDGRASAKAEIINLIQGDRS